MRDLVTCCVSPRTFGERGEDGKRGWWFLIFLTSDLVVFPLWLFLSMRLFNFGQAFNPSS